MADHMQMYFSVPDHYTIGAKFDTFEEAYLAALGSIKPIVGTESFTRAFVEVRRSDKTGDFPVGRVEVFSEGECGTFAMSFPSENNRHLMFEGVRPQDGQAVHAWSVGDRFDVFVGGWRVASLKTAKGALARAEKEAS